jgi:hypothetical protein
MGVIYRYPIHQIFCLILVLFHGGRSVNSNYPHKLKVCFINESTCCPMLFNTCLLTFAVVLGCWKFCHIMGHICFRATSIFATTSRRCRSITSSDGISSSALSSTGIGGKLWSRPHSLHKSFSLGERFFSFLFSAIALLCVLPVLDDLHLLYH